MQNIFKKFRFLLIFVILVVMVSVVLATVYSAAQQVYRNSANDPQVEAADQLADLLTKGAPAEALISQNEDVDPGASLSLFANVYDKDGKLVAGNGKVGGATPTPPTEVFDAARESGEHYFTWQIGDDVRVAAVVKKAEDDKGFALVAKSLKEVDARTKQLAGMLGTSWLILVALSALLAWVLSRIAATSVTIVEENNIVAVETRPEEPFIQ